MVPLTVMVSVAPEASEAMSQLPPLKVVPAGAEPKVTPLKSEKLASDTTTPAAASGPVLR